MNTDTYLICPVRMNEWQQWQIMLRCDSNSFYNKKQFNLLIDKSSLWYQVKLRPRKGKLIKKLSSINWLKWEKYSIGSPVNEKNKFVYISIRVFKIFYTRPCIFYLYIKMGTNFFVIYAHVYIYTHINTGTYFFFIISHVSVFLSIYQYRWVFFHYLYTVATYSPKNIRVQCAQPYVCTDILLVYL